MLKWLVTRGPAPPQEGVTDDPLATFKVKPSAGKSEQVYAVSRVNPLFKDEAEKVIVGGTAEEIDLKGQDRSDSTQTECGSVQSSGYGSKEADSVSFSSDHNEDDEEQENKKVFHEVLTKKVSFEDDFQRSLAPSTSVSQLRDSFESLSLERCPKSGLPKVPRRPRVDILKQDSTYVHSIDVNIKKSVSLEALPSLGAQNWPNVSKIAKNLQDEVDRIHEQKESQNVTASAVTLDSRMPKKSILKGKVLVDVVTKNPDFVTVIDVPLRKPLIRSITFSEDRQVDTLNGFRKTGAFTHNTDVPLYFRSNDTALHGDFTLISLQPDSLVTEETLRMMSQASYPSDRLQDSLSESELKLTSMDMPNFRHAFYTKGLYGTLNRSESLQTKNLSHGQVSATREVTLPRRTHSLAKKRGLNTIKDLWERSGLKTNGRKLLVDINDILQEEESRKAADEGLYDAEERPRSLYSTLMANSATREKRWKTSTENSTLSRTSISEEQSSEGMDNFAFEDDNGEQRPKSGYLLPTKSSNEPSRNYIFPGHKVLRADDLQDTDYSKSEAPGHLDTWQQRIAQNGSIRLYALKDNRSREPVHDSRYAFQGQGRVWTTENYFDRYKEILPLNGGTLGKKNPWESYYGAAGKAAKGTPRSLTYKFFPHPNKEAANCGTSSFCHDFTLDIPRTHHLHKRMEAEGKRRRGYLICLVFLAFSIFVSIVVGISWYCTKGQRLFGAI